MIDFGVTTSPCNYPLTFEASVNNGEDLPYFITLSQDGRLEFLPASAGDVGEYEILLTAATGNEVPLSASFALTFVVI